MKRFALCLLLVLPLMGCPSATAPTPPAAIAPGYLSVADQTLGESLAALNAFVNQEKVNYAALSPTLQAKEKAALNSLITATNIANASYVSFHGGSQTLTQAQAALTSAQSAQSSLTAAKGVQ